MSVIIALAALALLMLAAYRGYSVILFAPIAALPNARSTVGTYTDIYSRLLVIRDIP